MSTGRNSGLISLSGLIVSNSDHGGDGRIRMVAKKDGIVCGSFSIRNSTADNLIFKIVTTAAAESIHMPKTTGLLEPWQATAIPIGWEPGHSFTGKERFRVLAIPVSIEQAGKIKESPWGSSISKLWKVVIDGGKTPEIRTLRIHMEDQGHKVIRQGVDDNEREQHPDSVPDASDQQYHHAEVIAESKPIDESEEQVPDAQLETLSSSPAHQDKVDDTPSFLELPEGHGFGHEGCAEMIEVLNKEACCEVEHTSVAAPETYDEEILERGNYELQLPENVDAKNLERENTALVAPHNSTPTLIDGNSFERVCDPNSLLTQTQVSTQIVVTRDLELENEALRRKNQALKQNADFKDKVIQDLRNKIAELNRGGKVCPTSSASCGSEEIQQDESVEGQQCSNESTSKLIESVKVENFTPTPSTEEDPALTDRRSHMLSPVTFEVLEFREDIKFQGDEHCSVLNATLSVELREDEPKCPISLKLLPDPKRFYCLEVCFPPLEKYVRVGEVITHSFLQMRFMDRNGKSACNFDFFIDPRQGTCNDHHRNGECPRATFKSNGFVFYGQLITNHCMEFKAVPQRPFSNWVELSVTVTLIVMKICDRSCNMSNLGMFAHKLDMLIGSVGSGGDLSTRTITFTCGQQLESRFVFHGQLLLCYSPVFKALTSENVNRLGSNPSRTFTYPSLCPKTMATFLNYVYGRDAGIWLNDVRTNMELLALANLFLIAELATQCVWNLLNTGDEHFCLESVFSLIQFGREFRIQCLVDRGIQWMERQRGRHREQLSEAQPN